MVMAILSYGKLDWVMNNSILLELKKMKKCFLILLLGMLCGANVRGGNGSSKPSGAPTDRDLIVALEVALKHVIDGDNDDDLSVLESILDDIADLQTKKKVFDAPRKNDVGMKWTPLHFAADFGWDKLTDLLLANGASINVRNENNRTPLSLAAEKLHCAVVEKLVQYHADPNLGDKPPLRAAIACSDYRAKRYPLRAHSCIQCLLNANANVWMKDGSDKSTVLHDLVRTYQGDNQEDLIRLLLEHVNPAKRLSFIDQPNAHGDTALHCAAEKGKDQIVDLLIQEGASVTVFNRDGLSAYGVAVKNHRPIVAAKLKEHIDRLNEGIYFHPQARFLAQSR